MSSSFMIRTEYFDQDINKQHHNGVLTQNQQPVQQVNPNAINTRHHLGHSQKRPLSNPDAVKVPTRPRGRPRLTEEQRLANQSGVPLRP